MPTIFERIINGEIPCHKVWEDDKHLAFLDVNPRTPGHTLVVPKQPADYLFDLAPQAHADLWEAARQVAQKLKRILNCRRVCVSVVGYEVPHVHIHLFPSNSIAEVPFPPVNEEAKRRLPEMAERLKP